MKKLSLLLLFTIVSFVLSAQITTDPAFITQDYTGKIVITFDPSQGTGGMEDATQCYAHTGLITDESKSDSEWKYATPTWRGNEAKYKMTKVGDKWQLTIDNLFTYYACPTSTLVRKMAFVFNDGKGGSKEGKAEGGKDIFVEVYENGLNVMFTAPTANQLIAPNEEVAFTATSSQQAALQLKINGTTVSNVASGKALNYTHQFATEGDYTCVITATNDQGSVSETLRVCVLQANAPTAKRPTGMKDGINYHDNDTKATLVMYAKDKNGTIADHVFLLGDFNDWSYSNAYQLKRDGTTGYFWITIDGLTPGEEYPFQYAVKIGDKIQKVSDAYSEKILDQHNDSWITYAYPNLTYPKGGEGLLAVLQPGKEEFEWSDATLNFTAPDKNNLVIYELWVGNYSVQKTLKELSSRLDYFEDLGVNAIELMPVTEFDGNISWGYNPNHFFAIDKAYGTEHDYKTFVDQCHKRGIAVILDMVFNHASGANPWAALYWDSANNRTAANNPWFNVTAPHPYSVFHDYNHENTMVRNYFKEVLKYWIEEYKIDGYRMDLTKGFTQRSSNESTASNYDASRIAILKDYCAAAQSVKSDAYFIVEHFCVPSEENELVAAGMMPWNNANHAFSQIAMGYQSESNISYANKKNWVSFNESHDEERNFYKVKQWGSGAMKNNDTIRAERIPITMTLNTMLPGAKMFWQFAELGYEYNIDLNGRTGEKPVPDTLGWYDVDNPRMEAYKKVGNAIHLRTQTYPEMFTKGTCKASVSSGAIRTIAWTHADDQLLIVVNMNPVGDTQTTNEATVKPFPNAGEWYDYFTGKTLMVNGADYELNVPASTVKIYTNKPQELPHPLPPSEETAEGFHVFPTLATDVVNIQSDRPVENVQLFDLQGTLVKQYGAVSQINISDLSNGLYFLVCYFRNGNEVCELLKK